MPVKKSYLEIKTSGNQILNITRQVSEKLKTDLGFSSGIVNLFLQHTSASLTINENADPDVLRDLINAEESLAPKNRIYFHKDEGEDDMPAHIKSSLFGVSINIPFLNNKLQLGTWQGIYIWEHRDSHHIRKIVLTGIGE